MKQLGFMFVVLFALFGALFGPVAAGFSFTKMHAGVVLIAGAAAAGLLVLAYVGFMFMARTLRAAARPKRARGAIMAEFVIVIIPFLMVVFGLMQMAVASMAKLCVTYSAFAAARAAIVVVPTSAGTESANVIGTGGNTRGDFSNSQKMNSIRNATAYALITSSPSMDSFTKTVVQGRAVDRALDGDSLATSSVITRVLSKLVYAKAASAVTLLDKDGNVKTTFGVNDDIRARVTYLFPCQFPLVNRLVGKLGTDLPQAIKDELSTNSSSKLILEVPAYYLAMQAEHTLANQGGGP